MSEQNEGGCAFPFVIAHPDGMIEYDSGMTLRDYFAAKAIMGRAHWDSENAPEAHFSALAKSAYRLADAMIAEKGE